MIQFRKKYALIGLVLFCIEIYIALYVKDAIVRPYIGDLLVVILLYCLLRCFIKISVVKAAVIVFIFATVIEILQYFNWVQLLGLSSSTTARIVMGTSFEWFDLLAYAIGTALIVVVENLRKKGNR